MKRVGEVLRGERERQGKTLEEIAQETRVSIRFLRAIEEGDYEVLPDPIYIRGFVRSYALALGLDPEKQVLPFYRREIKEDRVTDKLKAPPRPMRGSRLRVTPKSLLITVAALVMVVFLGALFWQYHQFANRPVLIIDRPPENAVVTTDFVMVSGRTDKDAQLVVNGDPVNVNEKGEFRVVVDLKRGVNRLKIQATNQLGKETVKELVVTVKTDS